MGTNAQSAGVRLDPQLIYAIPLGAALLLDRWHPMRSLPSRLAAPVGILLVLFALTVGLATVRRFRAAGTSLQPWEPTTSLITDGPFRLSRNPVYLGYTLLYLGVGFWVNSVWPLLLLPLVVWLMHRLVISREETYLDSRFGETYQAYKQRVRRWL